MPEYSEEILDSNSISSTDKAGRPIPVTIPIALAPGIKVVYTTRLGGLSTGDYGNLNLGGKSGDEPEAVLSNRIALAEAVQARLSLVSQVHSGVAVDVDDSFVINTPFGFDVSGTHGETDTPHVIEADGQVTAQSGIALGMFAADCLPVLLGDPVTGIIGAAHCGRRGLERGVIGTTVDLMKSKGADPDFHPTDDTRVVVDYLPDEPVAIVSGAETNLKITTLEDIPTAERIAEEILGRDPKEEARARMHALLAQAAGQMHR